MALLHNNFAGRTSRSGYAPIKAAQGWLEGVEFSSETPLIDVSQAAPSDPPPQVMRNAVADYVQKVPQAHLYGPILGMPELRTQLSRHWSETYNCDVGQDRVAITSGCNQAFCAAISALADEGDDIILPTPWYFNHKMWLDMAGVKTQPLICDTHMLPSAQDAKKLIGPKTRAICLVSPNNPSGVEYPQSLLDAFYQLAKKNNIALVLDETYKDFHSNSQNPHALLQNHDWDETLIQLYSFSKSFRLTGHRVGAIITSQRRMQEIEKFLDTVTICPSQVGQFAALWGLENLDDWLAEQRNEIALRRRHLQTHFHKIEIQGWKLLGSGAYFAYFEHPYEINGMKLAQRLTRDAAILCLPGEMFAPQDMHQAKRHLRVAFANIACSDIENLLNRLSKFRLPLA
jgi:aspartate/methionine/tyrosine aminotransferase